MDRDVLLEAARCFGTPVYVYDAEELRRRIERVRCHFGGKSTTLLYAVKANPAVAILRMFREAGWGADVASPGEASAALRAGFPPERIVLTGTNLSEQDMRFALKEGLCVNLDGVDQLETFGRLSPGSRIWVRVNPEIAPHTHPYLATAGGDSKFGVRVTDWEAAQATAKKHSLRIVGLHCHIGSMLFDVQPYIEALDVLLELAADMETVDVVDIGGGMGYDYSGKEEFDWSGLSEGVYGRLEGFASRTGRRLSLYMEVGRWVMAAAGYLVACVVSVKRVASGEIVGVDCPFTQFLRPALYGARHRVVNISDAGRARKTYFRVVGNACESGDVLARDVEMAEAKVGDLLAFLDAGAYCATMASSYNGRPLPAEVMWDGDEFKVLRRRAEPEEVCY